MLDFKLTYTRKMGKRNSNKKGKKSKFKYETCNK